MSKICRQGSRRRVARASRNARRRGAQASRAAGPAPPRASARVRVAVRLVLSGRGVVVRREAGRDTRPRGRRTGFPRALVDVARRGCAVTRRRTRLVPRRQPTVAGCGPGLVARRIATVARRRGSVAGVIGLRRRIARSPRPPLPPRRSNRRPRGRRGVPHTAHSRVVRASVPKRPHQRRCPGCRPTRSMVRGSSAQQPATTGRGTSDDRRREQRFRCRDRRDHLCRRSRRRTRSRARAANAAAGASDR